MKRRAIVTIIATFLLSIVLSAQTYRWNATFQTYIDQYRDLAIQEMLKYNIPASITLAQGLLESGAGKSELVIKGNNHFGIKCHGWTGRTVYHDDDLTQECFRAYDNALQSFEDHSKFLVNGSRYRSLFSLKRTDYKGWARGLKAAGYATNPAYADRLISIIELYKLYEYDHAKNFDKFMAHHSAVDQPVRGNELHPIHIYNKNYYLQARKGDTYRTIAQEIGISYKKLARYNERDAKDPLTLNEVVWLKKKQKKADKAYENRPHRVKRGDSMYSIAQYYGIQLKSLYKMNHMSPEDEIHIGDLLRVR